MENKISEENATAQLQVLLDYYDIDFADFEDDKLRQAMTHASKKLVKAIQKGRLEIVESDGITIRQHLKNPSGEVSVLTYREVDGTSKVAMKSKGDGDNYGKIYAMMGSLSGLGDVAIQKLKGVDLALVENLGTLFLQV